MGGREVTMFAEKLTRFAENNGLPPSAVGELVQLFNEALVAVGQGILKEASAVEPKREKLEPKKGGGDKRWASKVAAAFAEEKGVTLDDFEEVKVTKQHILEYLKGRPATKKSPPPKQGEAEPSSVGSGKSVGKGKKVQCNGMTAGGDPCSRTGTVKPDGAANCYCFRHADQWRDFECAVSDNSDLEEEDLFSENGDKTENKVESEEEPELE